MLTVCSKDIIKQSNVHIRFRRGNMLIKTMTHWEEINLSSRDELDLLLYLDKDEREQNDSLH